MAMGFSSNSKACKSFGEEYLLSWCRRFALPGGYPVDPADCVDSPIARPRDSNAGSGTDVSCSVDMGKFAKITCIHAVRAPISIPLQHVIALGLSVIDHVAAEQMVA